MTQSILLVEDDENDVLVMKMALEKVDGVKEAEIKLVLSPPWSPDRMTDEARDHLGIF